jgi:hypothetical protein
MYMCFWHINLGTVTTEITTKPKKLNKPVLAVHRTMLGMYIILGILHGLSKALRFKIETEIRHALP